MQVSALLRQWSNHPVPTGSQCTPFTHGGFFHRRDLFRSHKGPRAQIDRELYRVAIQTELRQTPNLSIIDAAVDDVTMSAATGGGVPTVNGVLLGAPSRYRREQSTCRGGKASLAQIALAPRDRSLLQRSSSPSYTFVCSL